MPILLRIAAVVCLDISDCPLFLKIEKFFVIFGQLKSCIQVSASVWNFILFLFSFLIFYVL